MRYQLCNLYHYQHAGTGTVDSQSQGFLKGQKVGLLLTVNQFDYGVGFGGGGGGDGDLGGLGQASV